MGVTQSVSVSRATSEQLEKVGVFELRSSQRVGIQQLYEKVLKRLLKETNLYDFSVISDKNKCKDLILVVASTLEKEFTTVRFADPENPSAIRTLIFAPTKHYEALASRDSASARKRQAICEDIAFFMIRFVTYIAAITSSVYYTGNALTNLIRTDVERKTFDTKLRIFIPEKVLPTRPIAPSIVDFLRKYTDSSGRSHFRDYAALNEAMNPSVKNEIDLSRDIQKIKESTASENAKTASITAIETKYWSQEYFKTARYYYFDSGSPSDVEFVIDVVAGVVFWQRADMKSTLIFNLTVGITDRPAEVASRTTPYYTPQGYAQTPGYTPAPQGYTPVPPASVAPVSVAGSAAPFAASVGTAVDAMTLPGIRGGARGGGFTRSLRKRARITRRRRAQHGGESALGNYYVVEAAISDEKPVRFYLRRDGMVQDDSTGDIRTFQQKMVELFSNKMRAVEGDPAAKAALLSSLVNPLSRPLSGLYGPIYGNLEAFAKTLIAVPEQIKDEVGGSAPAFYRGFLLATRLEEDVDSKGKRAERIYTLLCENKWEKSFTNVVPYALLQALYKNAKDDDARADKQLKEIVQRFIREGVAEGTNDSSGFDVIQFAKIGASDSEFCKNTMITADRPVKDNLLIDILKKGHRSIRIEFDRYMEEIISHLTKAIRLDKTGVVDSAGFNEYSIHLEDIFFKDNAGSQRVMENHIAEGRAMIAKHYLEVEKIYVETVKKFLEAEKALIKPTSSGPVIGGK